MIMLRRPGEEKKRAATASSPAAGGLLTAGKKFERGGPSRVARREDGVVLRESSTGDRTAAYAIWKNTA